MDGVSKPGFDNEDLRRIETSNAFAFKLELGRNDPLFFSSRLASDRKELKWNKSLNNLPKRTQCHSPTTHLSLNDMLSPRDRLDDDLRRVVGVAVKEPDPSPKGAPNPE